MKDMGPFRRKGIKEYSRRWSRRRDGRVFDRSVNRTVSCLGIKLPDAPASLYDPDQLYESLREFSKPQTFVDSSSYHSAVDDAYRAFGRRRNTPPLRALVEKDVIRQSLHLEKSAGIYMTTKSEAFDLAWDDCNKIEQGVRAPLPNIALARTQRKVLGKDDNGENIYAGKTRLVWGAPLSDIINQAKNWTPIINKFNGYFRSPMAYDMRRYDLGGWMLGEATGKRASVGLDFSRFDATVPSRIIHDAFKIAKTWVPDFPYWDLQESIFLKKRIVMPDGHLYAGFDHGIPSGALCTQWIGSVCNYIVIRAAQYSLLPKVPNKLGILVMGDDSLFYTNYDIDLEKWSLWFKENFGMNLNVAKSLYSTNPHIAFFLGFDWFYGVPDRVSRDVLLSITQPERPRKIELDRAKEDARVMRLLIEAMSMGITPYKLLRGIFPSPEHALYGGKRGDYSPVTGYLRYQQVYLNRKKSTWRSVGTSLLV